MCLPPTFLSNFARLFACCLMSAVVLVSGCDSAIPSGSDGGGSADNQPDIEDDELETRIENVLDFSLARHMNTRDHGAWQILHGVLAYGAELRVEHEGELVRAVDVISNGGMINGFLLRQADHGWDTIVQAGSLQGQGHDDQWLAELSQGNMNLDYKIRWGDQELTLEDLLTQAKWDLNDQSEATWTLMALATFLPIDAEWDSSDGTKWNFERLVALEANRDINDPEASACGGTHRLVGLSMAINSYLAANPGAKLTGPWANADRKIQDAIAKAREFQQPDGAFSAQYFARAGDTNNVEDRIGTTGHTLEFLCFAMSDEQLSQPWVARSANHLCELLEATKDEAVECGALYHAIHGLQLYHYRRFAGQN